MSITIYIYSKTDKNIFLYSTMGNPEFVMLDIDSTLDFTLTPIPSTDKTWRWQDTEWVELLPINNKNKVPNEPSNWNETTGEWSAIAPINNPDKPYNDTSVFDIELGEWVDSPELLAYQHLEHQALMWERIKDHRQARMTGGVYVSSINRLSTAQYTFVALQLGKSFYSPLKWNMPYSEYRQVIDKWFHTDETSATQYAFVGLKISHKTYTPLVWKTMSGDFIQLSEALFNEVQDLMMKNTQINYGRAEFHKVMMLYSDNPLDYNYFTGWTESSPF